MSSAVVSVVKYIDISICIDTEIPVPILLFCSIDIWKFHYRDNTNGIIFGPVTNHYFLYVFSPIFFFHFK